MTEFDEIARLLDKEKKPLLALFIAYTPWVDSGCCQPVVNSSSNAGMSSSNHDGKVCRRINSSAFAERFTVAIGGMANRMRWKDALYFAKEFAVCPGLFSHSQFAEVFKSVHECSGTMNEGHRSFACVEEDATFGKEPSLTFPQVPFNYPLNLRPYILLWC
jgi:hypothetical protein